MQRTFEKTQPGVFVAEVIPSLFHSTPGEFIRYLTRDGNKFLRFYWEQAGTDRQVARPASAMGLNYDIRLPYPSTTVVLITLPRPAWDAGTYFIAAVHRPLRRGPFLGVADTTKVISLEVKPVADGKPVTELREWSRKLLPASLGRGPDANLEDFYQAVCELVKP